MMPVGNSPIFGAVAQVGTDLNWSELVQSHLFAHSTMNYISSLCPVTIGIRLRGKVPYGSGCLKLRDTPQFW